MSDRLKQMRAQLRETPLQERLIICQRMIAQMCSKGRPPRICVPAQWDDEDFYICETIRDTMKELDMSTRKDEEINHEAGITKADFDPHTRYRLRINRNEHFVIPGKETEELQEIILEPKRRKADKDEQC